MADIFKMKTWNNVGESEATDDNSVLNKDNMNDLESRINNAINSLKTTIQEEMDKELYYKVGDTYELVAEVICSGLFTSGQGVIRWSFITDKRLDNIKTINITKIKGVIRHADGVYLAGEGGTAEDLTKLGTLTCSIRGKNIINFILSLNEAKTQYSNNVPVAVSIPELGLTFK